MKNQTIQINKAKKILMVIRILAMVAVFFVGCDSIQKDEPIEQQLEAVLSEVLTFPEADDASTEEWLAEIESKNSFSIISCTEAEDKLVVKLLVRAPDLYKIARELDDSRQFESEEELRLALLEAVANAEIVEQEITIEYISDGDEWVPVLNYEFVNSYYGGVLKLFEESITEKQEETE